MNEYSVTINEKLSRTIVVEAMNPDEAYKKVYDMYSNEEIELNAVQDLQDAYISNAIRVNRIYKNEGEQKRMSKLSYLAEKARMVKADDNGCCSIICSDCPLADCNNGENLVCKYFENSHPDEATEIVRKWSEEHPRVTRKDVFFKQYPYAKRRNDGIPYSLPCELDNSLYGDGCSFYDVCEKYAGKCEKCMERYWNEEV